MESNLKVTIEKSATWSRRLTITVPAERLEKEKQTTARKLAQRIKLPGFRKGKVPPAVLEKRFGPAIEQETVERVVGEAYREAVKQEGLQPISQAAIDNIDYKPGSDLVFGVEFEIRPEIELNQLGGFNVHKHVQPVGEESVDSVLHRVREQRAEWKPLEGEAPARGDHAVVEITPLDGEAKGTARRYQVFIGEGQVRAEIEEHIRSLKPGETGEFDVDLPEDGDNPDSALKHHHIRVQVIEARRPVLPELTDEFAATVGTDVTTVAELRQRVRGDLEREADAQAGQDARRQLLDQVLAANPFEVPDTMVNRYLEAVVKPRKDVALDEERLAEMRQSVRPQAEQALRRMLVIERIAELEGLRPETEELDARYEEVAQQHGRSVREIRAQLKKEGREHEVEEQLTEDKVFRYLESLSTIE